MATRARVVWFWLATPSAGGSVQVVPSPTVNVRNAANTANISDTIYAADDPDPTILPQGFLGTANGEVEFYLEDAQRVTLRLSKTGFTSEDIPIDATFPANRFNPRGAWDVATAYDAMDVVSRSGTSWVALRANTGVTPVEGADWTVMSSGTGVTDHGALTGLADDDHPQYQLKSLIDAKGDLIVGTASDTTGRLAVGANGSIPVADSAATTGIAWRVPSTAAVATNQSTGSTSFTDLTTVGPTVTVTTGASALVIVSAELWNSSAGFAALMAFAVSGATSRAPVDAEALRKHSSSASVEMAASRMTLVTGLTPGSNTFTSKYRGNGGTANFFNRSIIVIPL
jgi:hypothetical protein